jgi:hypothetical protein
MFINTPTHNFKILGERPVINWSEKATNNSRVHKYFYNFTNSQPKLMFFGSFKGKTNYNKSTDS